MWMSILAKLKREVQWATGHCTFFPMTKNGNNKDMPLSTFGGDESNPIYTGSVHCHIVTGYWRLLGWIVDISSSSWVQYCPAQFKFWVGVDKVPFKESTCVSKRVSSPQTKPSIKDYTWNNKQDLLKWLMHELRPSSQLIPASLFLLFEQEIFMASSCTEPARHAVSFHKAQSMKISTEYILKCVFIFVEVETRSPLLSSAN